MNTTRIATVHRWDIYDIADELCDVEAQLQCPGLVENYDPLPHLTRLIDRLWQACYLSAGAAHELREQRLATLFRDSEARHMLGLPERDHDGILV